jgi:hypothetical protein
MTGRRYYSIFLGQGWSLIPDRGRGRLHLYVAAYFRVHPKRAGAGNDHTMEYMTKEYESCFYGWNEASKV